MERKEMLEHLQGHPFVAAQVDDDVETGSFHFISPQGAGLEPMPFNFWPAISLQSFTCEALQQIKHQLSQHALLPSHFAGTDLELLASDLSQFNGDPLDWNDVFHALLNLPDAYEGPLFCLYDTESAFGRKNTPLFFPDENALADAFQALYVNPQSMVRWGDMNDSVLNEWMNHLDDFDEFPMTSYRLY